MRAVVQQSYGGPGTLRVRELPEPVPAACQVLVRVRAASVHPDVWHVVTGRPRVLRLMGAGLRRPTQPVPGTDMAGTVVAVGREVADLAVGDEVFGETVGRNQQWRNGGTFAEYVAVSPEALAHKPAEVGFEQAATVPTAGLIALQNLPHERLAGSRVLVNGAAGGVGSLVVQIAMAAGAHVTGVERAGRADLVRALGADEVIDADREDFTRTADPYDLIVDIPGNRRFAECRRALAPGGRYVLIGHDGYGALGRGTLGSLPRFLGLMARAPFTPEMAGSGGPMPGRAESMARLAQLLADGAITPVVDATYPLEDAGRAIRHLADGTARGRIVLTP